METKLLNSLFWIRHFSDVTKTNTFTYIFLLAYSSFALLTDVEVINSVLAWTAF